MNVNILWNDLTGLTWLSLGNGWRNLFLLSCLLQAGALGTAFGIHHWFSRKSRAASFFTGVAATPLVQFLWTLALALVWPRAPKLVYIGALPALAGVYLLLVCLRRLKSVPALLRQGLAFLRRVFHFDKPALVSLCFALCMLTLLLPVCVRLCGSMNAAGSGDSGEYMALAERYCQDRDFSKLLEKDEQEGHFRGNSHFPSLELYMTYGLMHTPGAYGYPYDKPMLAGLGMLTFYMMSAFLALLLVLCRQRKRWVLLGLLLFNLVPNLYFSVNGSPRDIWRILALFVAALFFAELRPLGGFKAYAAKLPAAVLICFTAMSAHVVSFVVLPFIVVAWVLSQWYAAALKRDKKTVRALFGSVGIALGGLAGTLVAFWGNIWCYLKWGEMSPWRLMTTYTSAPWYEMYMQGEYKLEATTTKLNFWQARYDIVMAYATPIGLWGMRLALVGLVCAICYCFWRRHGRTRELLGDGRLVPAGTQSGAALAETLCYASLLTLCTLAPMTGLLDSKLYSFSGSFLTMQRYTLQWFLLAAVMIPAALAAFSDVWPGVCRFLHQKLSGPKDWLLKRPFGKPLQSLWRNLPALFCAALCVLSFWHGTSQTGYDNSFYRYSRQVMEDESTLLDNGFLQRYGLLMAGARHVPQDEKILVSRAGYQYPLHARGYVLTSNPIVPLLNLPQETVPAALSELKVAMVATEPDFWDERYYAQSTLSSTLNTLPPEQIFEDAHMRLYVLNPAAAAALRAELAGQNSAP